MTDDERALYREALLGRSWWQPIALGIVLVLAGLLVLRDAMAAKVFSAILMGIALLGAGLFEIMDSLWAPNWTGFVWRLLAGALYAIGGAALLADPRAASVLFTLAFAVAIFASGVVRMYLAVQDWSLLNGLLFASGLVGVVACFVILAKWPAGGLWIFGLMVGLDLLLHGIWWVVHGWTARQEPRPA